LGGKRDVGTAGRGGEVVGGTVPEEQQEVVRLQGDIAYLQGADGLLEAKRGSAEEKKEMKRYVHNKWEVGNYLKKHTPLPPSQRKQTESVRNMAPLGHSL